MEIEQNILNIEENKAKWTERFDEYEERMNHEKISITRRQSVKIAFQ